MTAPRLGSINLVVADVAATADFLAALGVGVEPVLAGWEDWGAHHRKVDAAVDGADLDSPAFAASWGNVPAELAPGVVVNLFVDARDEVDELHRRAVALGAGPLKEPWDAFWGARYAVVVAPGSLYLGIMSPIDDAHRTPPPDIASFG